MSNTGVQWQVDAVPGLLPPFSELVKREKTKTAGGDVEMQFLSSEQA